MKQVNSEVAHTWWARTDGFWVLTFAHRTPSATCVKARIWQCASPHYLSANWGHHAERDNRKHSKRKLKQKSSCGEVEPLSAMVWCRLDVEQILLWPPAPKPPRVAPSHHLASPDPPLMDCTKGSEYFWRDTNLKYFLWKSPRWPPLSKCSTKQAGVCQEGEEIAAPQ